MQCSASLQAFVSVTGIRVRYLGSRASERRSPDIYAEDVERYQPMCYTHANKGTAPLRARTDLVCLTVAKEEL
jgi:hypothetical protein